MIASSGYTYFIVAPHYRESSLGVQVLHRLCHMINERGGQAWMIGCDTNPDWNAPACTEQAFKTLMESGEPWIVVYPEVTRGNPLNAPVVVRYMLNREGVIDGNIVDPGDDDLFFWYRDEFADKEPQPKLLGIESYDLDLFKDDHSVKDVDLLYINRLPNSVVEFSKLPKNITILSMENPLSHKELAALLKRARVLYTYEASGTCVLANLCGCPVVALTAPGYEEYALKPETLKDIGDAGFSFSDSPAALATVKANLYKVRDHLLLKRKILQEQFDNFLHLTQQQASQVHKTQQPYSLGAWLNTRRLPQESTLRTNVSARILHVVFCRQASAEAIATTIDSIAPGFDDTQNLLLMVGLPAHAALDDGQKIFAATQENWQALVKNLADEARFDWLHCIDAGVCYAAEAIPLMQNVLTDAGACHAIYTDEALKRADGLVSPCFKPGFNLDLFLSSPQRYLRRFFFRRESWLEMGGFSPEFASSFEFELLIRYIFQWDIGCIGHISEVTMIVPEEMFDENCPVEERKVIDYYLQQRGFTQGRADAGAHGAWHIHYSQTSPAKISILIDAGSDAQLALRCVHNLLTGTDWPDLEVLLSLPYHSSPAFVQTMTSLANSYRNVRLFPSEPGHNYAHRMNLLEQQAEGEYLLLLNIHTLFLMKSWLSVLMNHMARPEVSHVGPKIISPEKKLLSAGIIVGADGWLGHIGQGESWQSKGYLGRYQCEQNYSALSGNCLLVRRSAWQAVTGMDESYDNEFVEDVVLSLTLHGQGGLGVWTPYSIIASDNPRLLRGNSIAGRDEQMTRMVEAMLQLFSEDPTYNRNLTLSLLYYRVNENLTTDWDPLSTNKTPSVLMVSNGIQGTHSRRLRALLKLLEEAGRLRMTFVEKVPSITELLRAKPSLLILSGDLNEVSAEMLDMLKRSFPCQLLALADYMADESSSQWHALPVDRWLTFYPAQHDFLQKQQRQVVLLPAGLSANWFAEQKTMVPAATEKARILCIPRGWKAKELNFMQSVIAASTDTVDWVVLGEWPKSWIPYVKETWRFVHNDISPEQLRQLNVDAAVIFHSSNDASRTRDAHLIYQLAACQIPVIASDVTALVCNIPVVRVKADHKKWLEALKHVNHTCFDGERNDANLSSLAKLHYQINDSALVKMCNDIFG